MATPAQGVDGTLCPNCHERIPDTEVSYEEAMFSEMQSSRDVRALPSDMRPSREGAMADRRSRRGITRSGTVMLCSTCAAAYQRCVRLRIVGSRVLNVGAVVMIVFALVYALILPASAQQGIAGLVIGGIAGLGALALLVGAGMYVSGRLMRRTAARFVGKLQTD